MRRFLNFLTHSRTLSVLGVLALTIILLLIALTFEIGLVWAGIALGVLLALWLATALWKRWRARRASARLEGVLEQAADKSAAPDKREEVEALRVRLAEAVKTIKRSKLGQLSGDAALYELPWYIVIGNPAAGKSTAVLNSGLQFPFADKGGAVIRASAARATATGSSPPKASCSTRPAATRCTRKTAANGSASSTCSSATAPRRRSTASS